MQQPIYSNHQSACEADSRTGALRLDGLQVGQIAPIALDIAPGEILCLSGPSGAGKSRILRAIADLDEHQGGVWLGQVAQSAIRAHCWRGWVMLIPAESPWWADQVGEHFGAIAPEQLPALGLDPQALTWQVSRLSSGEKQRLALLRARSRGPRALLLDEPTANLDPDMTLHTEAWLVTWIREQRLPVLWVSHDREQIRRVADRHYHIRDNGLELQ